MNNAFSYMAIGWLEQPNRGWMVLNCCALFGGPYFFKKRRVWIINGHILSIFNLIWAYLRIFEHIYAYLMHIRITDAYLLIFDAYRTICMHIYTYLRIFEHIYVKLSIFDNIHAKLSIFVHIWCIFAHI